MQIPKKITINFVRAVCEALLNFRKESDNLDRQNVTEPVVENGGKYIEKNLIISNIQLLNKLIIQVTHVVMTSQLYRFYNWIRHYSRKR